MSEPYEAPQAPEPRRHDRSVLLIVLAGVTAVLVVIGLIVAVGGDEGGSGKDAVALLSGAPDAVRDAESAHMTMSMAMKAGALDFDLSGDGAIEFATNRAHLTMSVMGTELEILSDGDTAYVHVPEAGQSAGMPPWVSFPASSMRAGGSFAGVESATGMLDALRGIGSSVDELGTEEVNGVQTTHYRAVVNLKDAIANAPEAQRAQAQAALEQFDKLGAAEMPVDVWISDDGLPIRQVITFDGADAGGLLGSLSMTMTIEMSDFGAPVDVQIPPADQVRHIDDPSQLGQLFGGVGVPS